MDNKYLTKEIEELFDRRLQIKKVDLEKEEEKKKREEISENKRKEVIELIGGKFYPHFASFAKLLITKNIECYLSDSQMFWSDDKIIGHEDKEPKENISLNFYKDIDLLIRETNKIPQRDTLIPPLSNINIGDTIQYFKKGKSDGYDVFEKKLIKREAHTITLSIPCSYYEEIILHLKNDKGKTKTVTKKPHADFEFVLSLDTYLDPEFRSHFYNDNIRITSDIGFDIEKYEEEFISALNTACSNPSIAVDIDRYGLADDVNRYGHYINVCTTKCLIREEERINIDKLTEDAIEQKMFNWLDTLINNKLLN